MRIVVVLAALVLSGLALLGLWYRSGHRVERVTDDSASTAGVPVDTLPLDAVPTHDLPTDDLPVETVPVDQLDARTRALIAEAAGCPAEEVFPEGVPRSRARTLQLTPWEQNAESLEFATRFGAAQQTQWMAKALAWPRRPDGVPALLWRRGVEATLGASDLRALRVLVEEQDQVLRELAEVALEIMLDARRTYISEEHFERHPLVDPGVERRPTDGSLEWWDRTLNLGGWVCVLQFRSADYPVLNDHLEQLEQSRLERGRAVERFLAER